MVVGFYATEAFQDYAGGMCPASSCTYEFGPGGQPDPDLMPLNHVSALLTKRIACAAGPACCSLGWGAKEGSQGQ